MIHYIYFVKCPGCEDEHFDFFDDAKNFAMGCLSQKPIITQVEVDRNDFGECTDSADLGTIWSWEEMMSDVPAAPEFTTFSKAETFSDDDYFFNQEFEEDYTTNQHHMMRNRGLLDDGEYAEFDEETGEWVSIGHDDNGMPYNKLEGKRFTRDSYTGRLVAKDFDNTDIRKPMTEDSNWNPQTPGYYGDDIFEMLDKLSSEGVYDFLYEYGWSKFDENAYGLGDVYDNITAWLDTNSGYALYSDLDKYFYHNGLDEACDRKAVPADMTIESLVEEMEENEDTVECKWCNELFDKSECRKEVDLGWLCDRCQSAIKSRGEELSFRENLIKESFEYDPNETIEFEYDDIDYTVFGPKRDADDWDEYDTTVEYTYEVDADEVLGVIYEEFLSEEDLTDSPEALEIFKGEGPIWLDDHPALVKFMESHFYDLLDKYYTQLLKYFEDSAKEAARDYYDENPEFFEESLKAKKSRKPFLEEFDEVVGVMTACPECGTEQAFDHDTGVCNSCGFII